MNSRSDKPLSLEELKQRNRPTPQPIQHPTAEEWNALLRLLDELLRRTEAQEAALWALTERSGMCPSQRKIEALAQDVAAIRAALGQAGKQKERRHFQLPSISLPELPKPRLSWLLVIPVALVLLAVWYAWDTLWNTIRLVMHP